MVSTTIYIYHSASWPNLVIHLPTDEHKAHGPSDRRAPADGGQHDDPGAWVGTKPENESKWMWLLVKTLAPSEPQNSWDLWMFIPLKMVLIGIDPYPSECGIHGFMVGLSESLAILWFCTKQCHQKNVNPCLVNHWLSLHGWFKSKNLLVNVGQASDDQWWLCCFRFTPWIQWLFYVILCYSCIINHSDTRIINI